MTRPNLYEETTSAVKRLNDASDEIEHQIEDATRLPWHVSKYGDIRDATDTSTAETAFDTDDELIVTAVNAMPAVAKWLRDHTAEHLAYECGWESPCAALVLADQILGNVGGA